MASISEYRFPHVAVSKYAVPRTPAVTEESSAPVMFVPFRSSKGPSNELRTIYTLGEFTNLFGSDTFEDYSDKQHELLQISNWLSNGGAIIALRMTGAKDAIAGSVPIGEPKKDQVINYDPGSGSKTLTFNFSAKYPGIFYKGMKVLITKPSSSTVYLTITSNDRRTEYEKFSAKSNTIEGLINASEYISADAKTIETLKTIADMDRTAFLNAITLGQFVPAEGTVNVTSSRVNSGLIVTLNAYDDALMPAGADTRYSLLGGLLLGSGENFAGLTANDIELTIPSDSQDKMPNAAEIKKLLLNKLETPFDVFMDADYPDVIKLLILKQLAYPRDDVHFYMDVYNGSDESVTLTSQYISTYKTNSTSFVDQTEEEETANDNISMRDEDGQEIDFTNVSYYTQYIVVNNTYTDTDIKVGPTYFLSQLVVSNDLNYGIQYPTAGLTRGVLTGATALSTNPDPGIKNELFDNQTNYIERDSRGYRFMCQLTRGLEDTALTRVNNSRTTNRIARDIEHIGRKYLFEFNDTTTLSNMRSEMNKYLNEWVQNRTLSSTSLEVEKIDTNSVEVQLGIVFTGTIEIISVAITIE